MSFGLDKCGRLISKRGNVITTEGFELPEQTFRTATNTFGSTRKATKKAATNKYLQRVRQVLRS